MQIVDNTRGRWAGRAGHPGKIGARPVGELARVLVARDYGQQVERSVEVAQAVAGLVDAEFRAHCHVAGVRSGVLTFYVDDEDRVYQLNSRWHFYLREELGRLRRGLNLRRIVFTWGEGGVPIPES